MATDMQHKLSKLSKQALTLLISNMGLKRKYKDVLLHKYVDELTNYDIGVRMGYTCETVANMLCKARKQMKHILEREKDLLPANLKPYILLLEDDT